MNTHFGPWSIAIQPHGAPRLNTFWKRRLRMLPVVARSRPVRPAVRLGLLLAAAAVWALPTLSGPSLLAQAQPDQPPQPSIPATLPDADDKNLTPPQPAEKPTQTPPAETPDSAPAELPELSSRKKAPGLPAGLLPATGGARDGLPFDPLILINDYYGLIGRINTAEAELEHSSRLAKKGFLSQMQVETQTAALATTRRKLEFLRKLVAISHEAALEELNLLNEQEKTLTALYRQGTASMKELLEVRRPLLQLKARLKILELLTESMTGADAKQPQPDSKPPAEDAAANPTAN